MSRLKNKTFSKEGYKLIFCRNCGRIIGETHLGEINPRAVRCKECKNWQMIAPPRIAIVDGKRGAYWSEPSNSCWTAF